jgi:hypothetical protein
MKKSAVSVFVAECHAGVISRSDLEEDTFLFSYDADCTDEHAVSRPCPSFRINMIPWGLFTPSLK